MEHQTNEQTGQVGQVRFDRTARRRNKVRTTRDRFVFTIPRMMTRVVDDRGNITADAYNTLDRETVMQFHDGSTRQNIYNEAGDVVQFIDENGSVMDNTLDAVGRKTQCDVTKASGVVGTDRQAFEYDGLSRQTMSVEGVGSTDAVVQISYDSLDRVIEDTQTYAGNTRSVTHAEFVSRPVGRMAYPNGREIENDYDQLYGRTKVSDVGGDTIATWRFFDPARVAQMVLGASDLREVFGVDCAAGPPETSDASPR